MSLEGEDSPASTFQGHLGNHNKNEPSLHNAGWLAKYNCVKQLKTGKAGGKNHRLTSYREMCLKLVTVRSLSKERRY